MNEERAPDTEEDWYLLRLSVSPEPSPAVEAVVEKHPLNFESTTAEAAAQAIATALGWERPVLFMKDLESLSAPIYHYEAERPDGRGTFGVRRMPRSMGRPRPPEEIARRRAEGYLALAKKYADAGYAADALERLRVILHEMPHTPSTDEARRLDASIRERVTFLTPFGFGVRSW